MASSVDSGYVDNWQTGKTVTECNLHMLTTGDCSDVIFRVGPDKNEVRAHRYVLVSRSCVFHAMFCGPLAEKGQISIPDIDISIFSDLLRFVYTDSVRITSENVTGLMYSSRKYAVDVLFNQCLVFLDESLTEANVCQILESCHGYAGSGVEEKAYRMLEEASEEVTKSPGFVDLCSGCLERFLKSEQLCLKEQSVFEATLSWAERRCQERSIAVTPESVKEVLGDLRYEIRFDRLSLDYLAKTVGPSGILTDSERIRMMDKLLIPSLNISPFKSGPREVSTYEYVMRFPEPRSNVSLQIPPGEHPIAFKVNKSIQLLGFLLYGPVRSPDNYRVRAMLTDMTTSRCLFNENLVKLSPHKVLSEHFFPSPITLQAQGKYFLKVNIPGAVTHGAVGGLPQVTAHNVTFTIQGFDGFSTSLDKGQIPGLIFRRMP